MHKGKVVKITSEKKGCASFSGGVDSFYTLKNKLECIHYGLYVHGFDISLRYPDTYNKTYNNLSRFWKDLDKELIGVRTNIRDFTDTQIDWLHTFTASLSGVAHCLLFI